MVKELLTADVVRIIEEARERYGDELDGRGWVVVNVAVPDVGQTESLGSGSETRVYRRVVIGAGITENLIQYVDQVCEAFDPVGENAPAPLALEIRPAGGLCEA